MKIIDGKQVDRPVLLTLRHELWPHYGFDALGQQISELMSSTDEFLYVGFDGDSAKSRATKSWRAAPHRDTREA